MGLPDTAENRARFIATVPLGRLSEPKDIASACLYLAPDEAEFITGVVLEVDGGRTIRCCATRTAPRAAHAPSIPAQRS
jgi:3-oxoacyl-[acyl-carrier protein] reductase